MPVINRRRAPAPAVSDDDQTPTPGPSRPARRASTPISSPDEDSTHLDAPTTQHAQMVKDLIRLALASEYSRLPLRRADISSKVLGTQSRAFRAVFDAAQLALRTTFGMELVELPGREKTQLAERRKAIQARSQKGGPAASQGIAGSTGTKSWILRSVLPARFHVPEILPPPNVPTVDLEAAYVGLYSFVIAVILISGGALAEAKLERHMKRVNADQSTPVDRWEKVLARMIKDGYVYKVKDTSSGDEVVEYMVGPRGRVEVGEEGVAGLVRRVYGETNEELEKKIERSLKLSAPAAAGVVRNGNDAGEAAPKRKRQNGKVRAQQDGESDDED